MGRRTLGGLILALWVVLVGWQVRRERFQPELARLAEAALALNPGVSFYAIEMGGRSVGQATSRLDTVPDGFVLEDVMSLELPALGQTGTAVARTRVSLSSALEMRDFVFSLVSEVGRFEAEGTVRGDSSLVVTIRSDASSETVEYRLGSPPVFSAVVPIRVAMGGDLEVGRSVRFPVFDPSSLSTRPVEVRVLERDTMIVPDSVVLNPATGRFEPSPENDTIPVWRIAETFGGVSLESWIDEDGRVIEASSPLGFSMRRTEYELLRQEREDQRLAGGGGSPVDADLILSTAIRSDVVLDDLEERDQLAFVLSGVDLAGFDLDGGRQTLRGDTLFVRRENWDALDPGYGLPYKSMDLADALRAEPLIQSGDPRIVEAARRIVGRRGEEDPLTATRRLTQEVYARLDKAMTFSVPSAVQVLESGRGDCNEHTVLFVAMARALGMPARTAVGLVYLDGSFFYHAWPEVWLGKWVAVDPTFGQWPADAAHIRFVVGGLAQQVEIVRLIGQLDIDVVEPDLEGA